MYIIISIFAVYALGVISFEYDLYLISFLLIFFVLSFNSFKFKKFFYNSVLIVFFILSFANCYYNSNSVLSQYINEEIGFIAEIRSQNKSVNTDSKYNSFNAAVLYIDGKKLIEKENTIIYVDKNQKIETNTIVQMIGNVADTSFSKNNLLFDYKKYLRSKKVYATIFTQNGIQIIKENYSALNKVSNDFKMYAENLFYSNMSTENADIILSIILGDVDYLDSDLYDNIKAMGLAHIFAVSGSHIVLMYGVMIKLFIYIIPSRRVSWLVTWTIIWFYGFLIGFPLSVLRSLIMFTLLFGSEVLFRRYNSLNSIALSALVLTIVNPYWLFDAGFLLSFSAALSLIIYNKFILRKIKTENIIIRDFYLLLFLQIFTLPVLAYYFNYIPIMGIFYNLLLIPIFTFILIYSFVLLIFGGILIKLFILSFKLFDYLLFSLRYLINLTENFGLNGISIQTFTIFHNIIFYLVLTTVVYLYNRSGCLEEYMEKIKYDISRAWGKIFISIIATFYFITYILNPMTDENLYLNVMDVGQGLFITVNYKNYDFLIDCGSTSNKNLGSYTVVPYLNKKGISELDGVFISHWDADHFSGIYDLISSDINVKNVFSSASYKIKDDSVELNSNSNKLSHILNTEIVILKKGDSVRIDDSLKLHIIWPDENYFTENINNTSLVLMIEFNGMKILIPGDIEADVENIILDDLTNADILIVPHHGSKTSSTDNFVKSVSPRVAVFSYGKNNYGIPSNEVVEKYKSFNSRVLSTFNDGEINFILKENKMYYNTYIGNNSENYFELYFEWMTVKLVVFLFYICLICFFRTN